MTELMKQRLIGSLLVLVVIAGTAFFLIDQTNSDDITLAPEENSDFVSSIEAMSMEFIEVDQETLIDPHQLEKIPKDVVQQETVPAIPAPVSVPDPTPAPAAAPEIASSTIEKSKSSWIVQLGSFSVQANAQALHDKASQLGYASRIERIGTLYRVRIGPDNDKQHVDSMVSQLSKKLNIDPQVLPQQSKTK